MASSSRVISTFAILHLPTAGRCPAPLADIPAWRIEHLVGCAIRNKLLYHAALTHPTAMPPTLRHKSYQRLEYLGDSVMELCIRELLMERTPGAGEGEMTMQAQALVSGQQLNEYAQWLGLDRWVASNAYSMRVGLLGSPYVLGDAFEALLGAVYLDRGLDCARRLLLRVLRSCPAVDWNDMKITVDYKGQLIKAAQARKRPNPVYAVLSARQMEYKKTGAKVSWLALSRKKSRSEYEARVRNVRLICVPSSCPLQRKFWTVDVHFDGKLAGTGSSFEKRGAEQAAARDALIALGEIEGERNEIPEK